MILLNKIQLGGSINTLTVSPDGATTLCGSDKGFIFTINNSDLAKSLHCENHVDSVLHVVYPPKISDKFASASEDGTIRLWDISE